MELVITRKLFDREQQRFGNYFKTFPFYFEYNNCNQPSKMAIRGADQQRV